MYNTLNLGSLKMAMVSAVVLFLITCCFLSVVQADSEQFTNLSFIVKDKQFSIRNETKAPSLCVVNHTLIQLSYHSGSQQLVYDVFAIEPDGSFNVISLENDLFIEAESADIVFHEASSTIIVAHSDSDHDLSYHLGNLNGGTIDWKMPDAIIYAEGGENPSLAITPSGVVIAVHSGYESNKLFYNLGRLDQNAAKIEWIAPVMYNTIQSSSPSVFVVENNTVIETHIDLEQNKLVYNVGKLIGTEFNTMSIKWLNDQWISYKNCFGSCGSVDLMVDPFGIIMVSYSEEDIQHRNGIWLNQRVDYYTHRLNYLTGVLNSSTVRWNDSGEVNYYYYRCSTNFFVRPMCKTTLTNLKTAMAFLKDYNHIYIESHDSIEDDSPTYASPIMNTLGFGVKLVNIEYKPYVKLDSTAFALHETHFNNEGPVTLEQTWIMEEQYSCTNTYHWESNFHLGISATASVKFFGSGVSTTVSASLDLSVGESSSMSNIFTWTETNTITVPPNSGNVSYSAVIYRDPHSIPFIATFQRGSTTWTEKGSVEVSHGAIYSQIISSDANNVD